MKGTPMEQIQYGIVGFGGIAENRVAKEGFALDKDRFNNQSLPFTLVGATDLNQKRKEAATALGIRWYETYEQLLDNPKIDAIYIATSNATHFKIAMQAMKAHKHIIIEKPMTTTVADAKELIAFAHKQKVSVSTNLMMTKNVYNKKTQDLLKKEVVGERPYATFHMEFLYGKEPQEATSWRCSKPEEIGGPIGDVGGHCLNMAEFLFQQHLKSLRCTYHPKTLDITVENGATITYTLENGIEGTIRVAFNQPRGGILGILQNLGYEIYGDKGVIRGYGTMFQLSGHQDEAVPIKLELITEGLSKSYCMSEVENIYQSQITEHAHSIKNKQPMDGSIGLRNIQQILACHESAEDGGKEVFI